MSRDYMEGKKTQNRNLNAIRKGEYKNLGNRMSSGVVTSHLSYLPLC